jgi:hypothetical protein
MTCSTASCGTVPQHVQIKLDHAKQLTASVIYHYSTGLASPAEDPDFMVTHRALQF